MQVANEFIRLAKFQNRFAGLTLPDWIETLPSPEPFPPEIAQAQLDIGESAAIALCLKQPTDALLIDESAGREVAARLGVRTIGIVGILIAAKNEKLIPSLKTLLDRLDNEANFWISADLRRQALQLAGE